MEGFYWDDLRKILHRGQTMATVQNVEENVVEIFKPQGAQTFRGQTDDSQYPKNGEWGLHNSYSRL